MRFTTLLRCTASAAVMTAVAGTAGMALAQDAEPTRVDEIIVTAQKREQSLQDVPIVVTTLSEELLEDAGVRDIKDLQILTPGLTVTSTSNETITTARIRGVGTVGDNPGLESSVGVVIDGVYRARNGVGFGDLGELSRIEVLKGPQGTLFGRNTSAGVINIITESASFTPGFEAEITGGNYGAYGVAASVTGPLSENLAGRLYFATRERDGFYDVITGDGPRTTTDDQNQDFWTVRGQLLWLPNDSISIRTIADYSRRDEYCCVAPQVRTGPTGFFLDSLAAGGNGVGGPVTGGGYGPAPTYAELPFTRTAYANRETDQVIEDMGLSVEANIDIPSWNATLTSITAARFWNSTNGQDVDYSGADVLYRLNDGNFGFEVDTLSQEFRLAGSTDSFDWLVGFFYANEDLQRNDSFLLGADFTPYVSLLATNGVSSGALGCLTAAIPSFLFCQGLGPLPVGGFVPGPTYAAGSGFIDRYSQSSESYAFFTNNTWRVNEALELTLGLRYTSEEKELRTLQTNIGGNGAVCSALRANPFIPASGRTLGCLNFTNPDFNNRAYTQTFDEGDLSGRFAVQYRFNPDFMAYAAYARGYKAGGFNLDRSSAPDPLLAGNNIPIDDTSFESETVDSFEFGVKSTWFDGSLLLNATYFNQTYENFQLNTFAGIAFVVESIPEVTSEGVDADFIWFTPVEGFTLQGGVTYAITEYGNFTAADLSVPSRFNALSLLPGNQVSFAPEWSASVAASFERSIGNGLLAGFNLSAKYTSEYNTKSDLLPQGMQDALTLWNGRISIGSEDERWTLELWGQNLTDEEYYQVVFNGPLQGTAFQSTPTASGPYAGTFYNPALDTQTYNAFLGQPRTWGVTLRVRY